jgi:hypothetical protein
MARRSLTPTLALALPISVMAGALVIVKKNSCVAFPVLFLAVSVSEYTPAALSSGVPKIVAVPSSLSANRTPDGRRPELVIFGVGSPAAVTVYVNAAPNAAVSAEPLVKAGPPSGITVVGALAPESPTVV